MSTPLPPPVTAQPLSADVLSVQSQVVYGYVGNNAALPTFAQLGIRTFALPTVMFSNTPHYPSKHGGIIPNEWFQGFLSDLEARQALSHLRAVQTGYLGSPDQARLLAEWLKHVRQQFPALRLHVDPVIGDEDCGHYVDPALVCAYKEHLLPMAQGLTPNNYELAQLSGLPCDTLENTLKAARSLLSEQTLWVVVTSAAPCTWTDGNMHLLVVEHHSAEVITHPFVDYAPKGTGDMFSAALTGYWLNGLSLPQAAQKAGDLVVDALRYSQSIHSAELQPAPSA